MSDKNFLKLNKIPFFLLKNKYGRIFFKNPRKPVYWSFSPCLLSALTLPFRNPLTYFSNVGWGKRYLLFSMEQSFINLRPKLTAI